MSAILDSRRMLMGLKAKYHFLKYVQNPTNTPGIFEMTRSFQNAATPELVELMLKPLLENSTIIVDFERQYWPVIPSLDKLKFYPSGSFGHEAYRLFQKWNLDVDLFPAPNFSSIQSYITSRIYQSHDFWHVLTGYDTSLENELALQAFGVGQYKQPISLAIIAGGLINLLQQSPENSAKILALISEGFDRGLKAKNLLAVPVLERLLEPLDIIQKDLGITSRRTL